MLNSEIAEIINNSQLIVGYYKDATENGVLITAYTLDFPVLGVFTGVFPA